MTGSLRCATHIGTGKMSPGRGGTLRRTSSWWSEIGTPAELAAPAGISEGQQTAMNCPSCHLQSWNRLYRRQEWDFVRCSGCGLVRLEPIPTDEQLTAHYETRFQSGNYEPAKAAERLPTLRGVFAEFSQTGPGRLFDVGCFDGGLLDIAAGEGWETWGIDYQGPAVEIAATKHAGRIAVGPLEAYEPPRRDFDAVLQVRSRTTDSIHVRLAASPNGITGGPSHRGLQVRGTGGSGVRSVRCVHPRGGRVATGPPPRPRGCAGPTPRPGGGCRRRPGPR